MEKKVAIIIPIYKDEPSQEELSSFTQCLHIFSKYPVFIVSHQEVNLSAYEKNTSRDIQVTNFASHYFSSISGYNELMKSHKFYNTFGTFEYILIYQLDAWVFKDDLNEWCSKGYDYIGAPWIHDDNNNIADAKQWRVGNGGFSLRKVKTFLKLTCPYTLIRSRREILFKECKSLRNIPAAILHMLGFRNNIRYWSKPFNGLAEDLYFCDYLGKQSNTYLFMPTGEEASKFAFEMFPGYLYNKNNQELPLGCHAWEKHDKEFWKDKIQYENR